MQQSAIKEEIQMEQTFNKVNDVVRIHIRKWCVECFTAYLRIDLKPQNWFQGREDSDQLPEQVVPLGSVLFCRSLIVRTWLLGEDH